MTFSKKTGGAFAAITAPKRRSGGAWVTVADGFRRSGGAWVRIWQNLAVAISNRALFSSGAGVRVCGYQINADGVAYQRQGLSGTAYSAIGGEWLVAGSAADVQVMASGLTGTSPSGTFNTWMDCTTTRTWELSAANSSCSFTVQLRNKNTLAVLDTITVTMENESV